MKIADIITHFKNFLYQPIDENLLFDPGNTPYACFTLIHQFNNTMREHSFGTFLNIKRQKPVPTNQSIPSNYRLEDCVRISKLLQATHLEEYQYDEETEANLGFINDEGFCSSLKLNNDVKVIISIVASPEDSKFFYTFLKARLEIIALPN